jgi:hypothetical protein
VKTRKASKEDTENHQNNDNTEDSESRLFSCRRTSREAEGNIPALHLSESGEMHEKLQIEG